MNATKPIPDDLTILSIPIDATKRGNDLRVKTLSVLKEENGSILLLKSGEDNNIWWKVRDNNPQGSGLHFHRSRFLSISETIDIYYSRGKGQYSFPSIMSDLSNLSLLFTLEETSIISRDKEYISFSSINQERSTTPSLMLRL